MKLNSIIAESLLLTSALAYTDGVDCTSSEVDNNTAGLLYVFDSSGIDVYCEDINNDVSAANGYTCYRTDGNSDSLGQMVKCPGDSAPTKNPDGTDAESVADGLMQTWCDLGGPFEFANIVACMMYGYYEANGDPIAEAESGATGVCDTIFAGACTWFEDIAPEIAEGMDRPCVDDPGSNACAFANPGKRSVVRSQKFQKM